MGYNVQNHYPGYHYQNGVLVDAKPRHHHGIKSIDATVASAVDGADFLACYDEGKIAGNDGKDFIAKADALGLDDFRDWLEDSDRGASYVDDEMLSLPRPM